jgi:hypothetical protein
MHGRPGPAVESYVRREVVVFLSDSTIDPIFALEAFMLE